MNITSNQQIHTSKGGYIHSMRWFTLLNSGCCILLLEMILTLRKELIADCFANLRPVFINLKKRLCCPQKYFFIPAQKIYIIPDFYPQKCQPFPERFFRRWNHLFWFRIFILCGWNYLFWGKEVREWKKLITNLFWGWKDSWK